MKILANRNVLSPVEDLVAQADPADSNSCNALFALLNKHPIKIDKFDDVDGLIKSLPRIDEEKFRKVETEIIESVREKLKRLLEMHVKLQII